MNLLINTIDLKIIYQVYMVDFLNYFLYTVIRHD
jgi:hypothetical protein